MLRTETEPYTAETSRAASRRMQEIIRSAIFIKGHTFDYWYELQWKNFRSNFPAYADMANRVRLAFERGQAIQERIRPINTFPDFHFLQPILLARVFPTGKLPTSTIGSEHLIAAESAKILHEAGDITSEDEVYELAMWDIISIPEVDPIKPVTA